MGVVGLLVLWLLHTLRDRSLPGEVMEVGPGEVMEVGPGDAMLVLLSSNAVGVGFGLGDPLSNLTSRFDPSGVLPLGRLPVLLALL